MCKFSASLGLIFLSIIAAASIENNEKTNILATALFYKDSSGVSLLATGPLSPDTQLLISQDLRERFQTPLQVRVEPAYKNFYEVPVHNNLLEHVLKTHPRNIFILNLTPVESRRVMHNMEKRVYMYNMTMSLRRIFSRKQNDEIPNDKENPNEKEKTNDNENLNEKEKTNDNENPNDKEKANDNEKSNDNGKSNVNVNSNGTIKWSTNEPGLLTPEDFVPNDIYYAIEKRCVNWATGCQSNAGSILDMPSKYFSMPKLEFKIPYKLQWMP